MKKYLKSIVYIFVFVIFFWILFYFKDLLTLKNNIDNNVKIIEKENIIKKEIYNSYENRTNFLNFNTDKEKIFFELRSNIDISNIKNSNNYKKYYAANNLWISLIKYLEKQKIYIDELSYNSILNLKDFHSKIQNPITKEAQFEIPVKVIKTEHENDFFNSKDITKLKFNVKENTISIKVSDAIVYNWEIELDSFIGNYVYSVYYFFDKKTEKWKIFIKKIDNNFKIWYTIFNIDYEWKNILKINNSQEDLKTLFKQAREKCNSELVVKEYLYPSEQWNFILTCITSDKVIYSEPIYL